MTATEFAVSWIIASVCTAGLWVLIRYMVIQFMPRDLEYQVMDAHRDCWHEAPS